MVKKAVVIKFGGSATISENGLNPDYIENFLNAVGYDLLKQFDKVVFVIGGGVRARRALNLYGPEEAVKITHGHAGQLSYELNKAGIVCDLNVPTTTSALRSAIEQAEYGVAVGGLEVGQTTDAVAISAVQKLVELEYQVQVVILSNIETIYTDDPKKTVLAQPIRVTSLDWLVERNIVVNDASRFSHGMNVPLDPVAVERYQCVKHVPLFFSGAGNTEGVRQFLSGKPVQSGTLIAEGRETCFYP